MPPNTAATPPAAPNWPEITGDVFCPLCEYNLRGLSEPRCPECGYTFEWPQILDPQRRLHSYLFEHHPERSVWSFFRTLLGSMRPKRFWRALYPAQAISRSRLRKYGLIVLGVYVAGVLAPYVAAAWIVTSESNRRRAQMISSYNALLDAQVQRGSITAQQAAQQRQAFATWPKHGFPHSLCNLPFSPRYRVQSLLLFLFGIWGYLTYLTLRIFRWSMRRANIRADHVRRCCIYSFPGGFWTGCAGLLLGAATLVLDTALRSWPAGLVILVAGLMGVQVLLGIASLATAYRCYLRFDRPLSTVLASQAIVTLAALNVFVVLVLC